MKTWLVEGGATALLSVMVFLFLVACCATEPSVAKEPKRSRILPYALTPSMRIGRRSEGGFWDPYSGIPSKRNYEKIMTFMRTGRAGDSTTSEEADFGVPKRTGPPGGMWFGPRLGRVQKRNFALDDDQSNKYNTPWTYVILNRNQDAATSSSSSSVPLGGSNTGQFSSKFPSRNFEDLAVYKDFPTETVDNNIEGVVLA